MVQNNKKLEIVQKYYLRNMDGSIDYNHPYDLIQSTNHTGMYLVHLDGHIGYMDESGKIIVPIAYDCVRQDLNGCKIFASSNWLFYKSGIAVTDVFKNNLVGIINDRGEELVPCEFESVRMSQEDASNDFIPVAAPSTDGRSLVWGMYDVKNKRLSVIPQYEDIKKEKNGYASFKKDGKWGLLHCCTGLVVVQALYLLELQVYDTYIVRALLGGSYDRANDHIFASPEDCHILVINGIQKAQLIVSGYDWIEQSGPFVVKCRKGSQYNVKKEDSFKILRMPDYIALVKNAHYEAGYFLKGSGKFTKTLTADCISYLKQTHAKYSCGGTFSAITYDGKHIPVTEEMKLEIQARISKE